MITLSLRDVVPPVKAPAVRNSALYEAGSTGTRRTYRWHAPSSSANQGILANLTTLRDRSRAAVRNDGYAKGTVEKLAAAIIGTGIKPLSQAPDPMVRKAIHQLWFQWVDESDADGELPFYGQQMQAVRCWLEAGEMFARLRLRLASDGLSVPLQIQNLEPELCAHDYNIYTGAIRVRAGIEFNAIGRKIAYYFHPSRPELDDFDASRRVRLSADSVVHLYDPSRCGQLRGQPHLTQALIDLYELDQYDDAQLLRQKIANLFAGFIKRPPTIGEAETLDPLTGQVATTLGGVPLVSLEAGLMQELDPGEEIQWSQPPEAPGYPEFMRQQLSGISSSTGLPYETLTGDMRGVNDRTVRVILNEFRGRVTAWQHHIVAHKYCRPIWCAWMDQAFNSGALPLPADYLTNPRPWQAVKWTPPRVPYIQPVQDIEAQKAAIRAGLTSRSATVSEYGDDAEAIDLEQAMDNERADKLALKYDSDGRNTGTSSKASSEPDPQPEPAQTGVAA